MNDFRRSAVAAALWLGILFALLPGPHAQASPPADVPTSRRARAAIAHTAPRLERDLAEENLTLGSPIFIRIFKASKELEVWIEDGEAFRLFRTYKVCSVSGKLGPKTRQGDHQAPEGFYFVTPAQMNPASRYHLSFNLGYPNAFDRHHGRTGSALMVHGRCVSDGCFAMTDPGIDEIYTLADRAFRGGQRFFRVHIFPFRMTGWRKLRHRNSEWRDFWENLEEGYELFEETGRPPDVTVHRGRYVFKQT